MTQANVPSFGNISIKSLSAERTLANLGGRLQRFGLMLAAGTTISHIKR